MLLAGFQLSTEAQTTTIHHYHHKVVHHTIHHHKRTTHTYKHHNIAVSQNDDHAAYEGKSSRSNDGVKKNIHRNMNYQNNSANLPPNNGNNAR